MTNLLLMLGFFIVSFLIGYLLISRIPSLLHTPLMSMTNAVSGVTILGALLLFTVPGNGTEKLLGSMAIIAAAFNVVGGFTITDRMLGMFKGKSKKSSAITTQES
ncbi:MAG: NAD(P) transhydrogenase subunit alpha [Desulfamplus sp.]|nr:NAD(P) transhydrogenase subunit alpha [Desulfamplus sp.]